MPRTAWIALGVCLGALVAPLTEIAAALLAHEHPWDRSG